MKDKEDLQDYFKSLNTGSNIPSDPFLEKLNDFLEALKSGFPDVDGRIKPLHKFLPAWNLQIWPKYRPTQKTFGITVSRMGGTGIAIHGENERQIDTPDKFWSYLLDFAQLDNFKYLLHEYKRRNNEPVDGFLKLTGRGQFTKDDVSLEVHPNVAKAICLNQPGPYLAEVVLPPPLGIYISTNNYQYFSMEDIYVKIDKIDPPSAGNSITIYGTLETAG